MWQKCVAAYFEILPQYFFWSMREISRMLSTLCIKVVFRENLKDKSSGAIKLEPTCSGIIFKTNGIR
jgi:hypothetical protein